jgi:hypothetical protein
MDPDTLGRFWNGLVWAQSVERPFFLLMTFRTQDLVLYSRQVFGMNDEDGEDEQEMDDDL